MAGWEELRCDHGREEAVEAKVVPLDEVAQLAATTAFSVILAGISGTATAVPVDV